MRIEFTYTDDDGGEEALSIPAKYEVCDLCRGSGSHVNPAIDGNGLSADDVDELGGDEFMDDYMSGVYDVPCRDCRGVRVELVVDEDAADPVVLRKYHASMQAEADYRAEVDAERRVGA